MHTSHPISSLIKQRFSCRKYQPHPIDAGLQNELKADMALISSGPFGNRARFQLVAAVERDRQALRSLGTYGFIRNPAGFIIGATKPGKLCLEDYGYLLEMLILKATDLDLGTCWLGGTFTQKSFSRRIAASSNEIVPAVVSIGLIAEEARARHTHLRRYLGAPTRLPWERLFFNAGFDLPLAPEQAGDYALPLEMVRLAPSASNKQPWRIVQSDGGWHFYLKRSPGYRKAASSLLRVTVDLQRVDMGIAMCHFELVASEVGIHGNWKIQDPGIAKSDSRAEYLATWKERK